MKWSCLVFLAATSCAHSGTSAASQPELVAVSITAYGASPDLADNRAAIQAALNANVGGAVTVPSGRYTIGRTSAAYYGLTIPAGTTLRGESRDSSVLVQAAGTALSVRLLEVDAPGVTVQGLTLDGQRSLQTADEHRAGVFATAARLTVRDVIATGFSGDGLYLYTGADASTIDSVLVYDNGRNGLTYGGQITDGVITGSTFNGNAAQQVDSEPGSPNTVNGITITGCTIESAGDYALTVSGSSATALSHGWNVAGNTINGAVLVVGATQVAIKGNHGTNASNKPSVRVYRTAADVAIADNDFVVTAAEAGIDVLGTGPGHAASNVAISGNKIRGGSIGIRASGALSVSVTGNTLAYPRGGGYAAIMLRATDATTPFASRVVAGNTATGYDRGLLVAGVTGSTATLTALTAMGNALGADMVLDDGSGALQAATLTGNTDRIARWPAGAAITTTMTRSAP